ncbi:glycoside hydrolase family 20 protein [Syncephalis fuscata]|nr:glycoside hydrolase family 20 protein [Syncephalis fuscata]
MKLLGLACDRYQKYIAQPDGLLPEARTREAPAGEIATAKVVVTKPDTQLDDKTDESYTISVSDAGVTTITANTVYGAMHGLESFTQLVRRMGKDGNNERYLPGVPLNIEDRPAFAHRGVLLDTARTYFPVSDILRQIDAMAVSKLNVFHWHIVDSQSFPLVSEVLPLLSQRGAYSPQMVYTKQDVQHIVQYARERGIRVIPEFDTPGHTYAWGLAYPDLIVCPNQQPNWMDVAAEPPSGQLDPTKPESLKLVSTLLKEQAKWFPDPFVHIGGDEVNQKCYTNEPHIADYLQKNNMNAAQLIGKFAQELHTAVRSNNKTPVTWEEAVLEYNVQVDKNTIVQVWTNPAHVKEVVAKGLRVITSPAEPWYLDCGQGGWINTAKGGNSWCDPYKTWQHVYNYDPLNGLASSGNTDASHPNVLGGEVAMWTEKVDPLILDMRLWPRAAAAGEVLWSNRRDANGQERTTKDALPRIYKLRRRLAQMGLRPEPINMLWCELHPGGCEM